MKETFYLCGKNWRQKKYARKLLNIPTIEKQNKIIDKLCKMPSYERMKIVDAAMLHESMIQARYLLVMAQLKAAYSKMFTVGRTQCGLEWNNVWSGLRASDTVFMCDLLCSHHRPEIVRMAKNMAFCKMWSDMDDENKLMPW
jgi:hypothetical protein